MTEPNYTVWVPGMNEMENDWRPSRYLPSPEGTLLSQTLHRKIIRISEDRVVKFGFNLNPSEAANLQFVAENTTIPVPKPYDVGWEDGKVTSIEMDYIPGNPLDKVWPSMDSTQRLSIANQLQGYISQLRKLKGDFIGSADRGKITYGSLFATRCGPFDSEKAFNEWRLSDIKRDLKDPMKPCVMFALPDDHEILFTHGDISARNINVDENGNITGILDWETSGWYPEYWEYVESVHQRSDPDGWTDYHSIIFPDRYERDFINCVFMDKFTRHN
ncbi:unnamed protein product [Penicillium salamii]|uniref:Aminoglycoside phosphotransferase domain-containing protein n=1 Tax=Penicillium salamii TaxID=1612424 RepID=A0A9W4JKC4_9EURO|nr:unnamed protein product [Penicillium salamii]CAG8140079.1 unnamed protein product [Penicillium salamii]CAG8156009.1 unnamed protein product [Penicillium salamii]CAG8157096.1 unnamed protein product [Penicillium salamii]CAG8159250.1 unnamed protein product [Penicillium salamii]